ncbi:Fic family protein [Bacillus cereus]|uniref:Fic family protein n=1 Tax=Bacillus cereus TaxID=1396 RepID=UPI003D9548AD
MRNFFEDKYINIELKRQLINLISEISEYKGKLDAYQEQRPDIFNNLKKIIPLHYTKNFSTTYTDKKISNKRIKELTINKTIPESITEDAIFCYNQTFSLVHEKAKDLSINPKTIQELHFQLMNYNNSDSGIWRDKPFSIPKFKNNTIKIHNYCPLPYELISQTLEDLCNQYNALKTCKGQHSLLLIARFILNFYCIFPFSQGNGRLTLMLIQLLLLKNGHTFVKYVCVDKYINEKQFEYYEAIYKSSVNWYCNEHNISFWLKKFLIIILEAYKDLHNRIRDSIFNQSKLERIQNFILSQNTPFTKETICGIYPDIAEGTISKTLYNLQLAGEIKLISKGRSAHWMKISP